MNSKALELKWQIGKEVGNYDQILWFVFCL